MIVDEEKKTTHRMYKGWMAMLISAICIFFTVYHVLYISGIIAWAHIFLYIPQHLAIHLGLILAIVFLIVPMGKKSSRTKLPWYDVILCILGVGWNGYILFNFDAINARGIIASLETYEVIGAWINMILVLEAARRIMGFAVPGMAFFFLIYALFSQHFPGFLRAGGHDWLRVGRSVGLFTTGMYGDMLNISATIMVSFILFAQLMVITGAGQWFIDVAQALLGHLRGGPAKVAVVASSLMGMLSGSSVVNVATIGVFTIPLMKATGYKAPFAGAVEAAASNGGQIMPPIMGIAAFMMVDFLQVPYGRIILAGMLPAIAYYFALFLMVDFEAVKLGLSGIPRDQLPPLKKTLMEGWQYILPLATLVFLLLVLSYSAELSALYSAAVMVIIGVFNKKNRLTPSKILKALKSTATDMMLVATTLGVSSIIVGCVQLTGLSYRLSMGLVNLAGGNVWLLLVLTALACIALGMGMTTSAVYVIMATLVAPALVSMGFIPLAAHFFVFYFGVAALITPPVCAASYVAAGIAQAPPMRTGFIATRLAIVTFMAPFIFVFEPAFLWEGTGMEISMVSLRILVAIVVLVGGLGGYMFGNIKYVWRALFLADAFFIMFPGPSVHRIAAIIGAALLLVRFLKVKFHGRLQSA